MTKRLYAASAIAWALALLGVVLLSPAEVRRLVSPWRCLGYASARGWVTPRRWAAAGAEGRLFACVRPTPPGWPMRRVAERVATTVSACAVPSLEPPALDVLAFVGAARAR